MTTPIDQIKLDITELESKRESLHLQFQDLELQLKQKNVILTAFNLVSSDASLYTAWQEQAKVTPAPQL